MCPDTLWIKVLAAAAICYCTLKLLRYWRNARSPDHGITEFKKDLVYVFEFPREWTRQLVNLSPYAVKLESWLRLKGVQYQVVETKVKSKTTKQIPYVIYNGTEYADTLLMLDQLTSVLDLPKDDLTPEQEGVTRAFIRMVDDGLAMTHFMFRYCFMADRFFGRLFRSKKNQLSVKIFKFFFKIAFRVRGHVTGIGRHSQSVVGEIGKDDIRALSKYLGEKNFMFGKQINAVDCAIFGQLSHIVYLDLDFPHKDVLDKECSNIKPYLDRIKDSLWKDWDEIVNPLPFQ